jgi:hypothetical protein
MVHDLLSTGVYNGFANYDRGDPGDQHGDDFRARVKGKTYRCKCFSVDEGRKSLTCMLLWIAPAIDHMWRRVQHLDAQSGSLKSIVDVATNPFTIAAVMLTAFLVDDAYISDFQVPNPMYKSDLHIYRSMSLFP